MVHSESSERKKRKPRGRPFTSDNNPRKPKRKVLDASGLESSDEGGIVVALTQSAGLEALKEGFDQMEKQAVEDLKETVEALKEEREPEKILTCQGAGGDYLHPIKKEEPKEGEIIDSIEFKNGSNVLKIVFKKQHNRSFRIQAFLNETTEIRPVTYTGSSTASSFWNLLKGSLKKD
jgi:hypothetical protein